MRVAVGTSLLIIALISLGGLAGHFRFGGVDERLLILLLTGSAGGIVLGSRWGNTISPEIRTRSFAILAIGIAMLLILHNGMRILLG